jgi:predicted anti-sigma-YlaC factor YlaD
MTCEHPFEDGAYVLGALSPTERAEYERHLSTCASCRASVAALAVLPGLLGRLDAATVTTHPETAPRALLPRTLAVVANQRRAQRRRRRLLSVAAGVLVLVLAAVVGIGVRVVGTSPVASPAPEVMLTAMRPVVDNLPISAKVGLVHNSDGTDVDMQCRYAVGKTQPWVVKLVAYPRTLGEAEVLGTWTAASDQDWSLRTHSALAADQIGRIELQLANGVPLLVWTPP